MPRAKETLRVQINEQTEGETRLITITVAAPVQEFLLTDILRQRGAIGSMEAALKQVVRESIQSYLDNTEELIAGLAAGQGKAGNGTQSKGQSGAEGRSEEAGKGNGVRGGKGSLEAGTSAVSRGGDEAMHHKSGEASGRLE